MFPVIKLKCDQTGCRDICVEMRELLEAKRDRKGRWSSAEAQDWESLVLDIAALNRVIDYYGG
jgi:hypothetical protein